MIYRVNLTIIPLHNMILPTPSSKVIKYLILSGKFMPSLRHLVTSRDKYKPLLITNLGKDGKRITNGERGVINAGTQLNAFIAFSNAKSSLFSEIRGGEFMTPYGEFYIRANNVESIDIDRIEQKIVEYLDKNIDITFITPAILSSKLLLPPSMKEKFKDINVGFSTLPSVGLIVAHAYNLYCNVIGKKEIENKAFKLAVLANALSRVIGYNLIPVTTGISKNRKPRGVIGWIKFDIPYEKLKRRVLKYLIVASYLGIGRSRGIGFGEIKINSNPIYGNRKTYK